ncbi:MAG: hypothetical protein ABJB01_05965 [Rudaea sp.]
MRISLLYRLGIASIVLVLGACAQQPTRTTPAKNTPPATTPTPEPPTASVPKPKPKTKPVSPTPTTKPDAPKEPDVNEAEVVRAEGIDKAQVGYYFDTLQGRLRQTGDPNIVVSRNESHITVDITDRVRFASDGSVDCVALAPISKALVEYRMTRITVDVSAVGESGGLSAKSGATALAHCFVASGVASKRVSTKSATAAPRAALYLHIDPIVKTP